MQLDVRIALTIGRLVAFVLMTTIASAQERPPAPIYSVTVVSHDLWAANYQNETAPVKISFKGTVLMPSAEGGAVVESKKGSINLHCKFGHVEPPQRFGTQYVTYVLWALTPDGRSMNLGEVVLDASDKADLHVTTGLPVFALIVTAEPYFTVSRPSGVVVLENELRPGSVSQTEPVHPRYELLPGQSYTYQIAANNSTAESGSPKVSMAEYQALVELYQAQNAVQIARTAGADQLAPETYNRAVQLLVQAQDFQKQKKGSRDVVTAARAATEAAEDAREVATKKRNDANATK